MPHKLMSHGLDKESYMLGPVACIDMLRSGAAA